MVDESDEEDDDEHDVGDDEGVDDVDDEVSYRYFRPERHGGLQTQDKCTDPHCQHPQVADVAWTPVETARRSRSCVTYNIDYPDSVRWQHSLAPQLRLVGRIRLSYASNSSNPSTNPISKITCSRDPS